MASEEVAMSESGTVSVVLFSGTDDKLGAATMLVAGAAATGKRVNVLIQDWALDAFRRDAIHKDHGVSAEAGAEGHAILARWQQENPVHWSDTLRHVKDLGPIRIVACALSMDMFGLVPEDLDPMVDGVEGIASFWAGACDGPVLFV
jgi:peroxiredoxin family protein